MVQRCLLVFLGRHISRSMGRSSMQSVIWWGIWRLELCSIPSAGGVDFVKVGGLHVITTPLLLHAIIVTLVNVVVVLAFVLRAFAMITFVVALAMITFVEALAMIAFVEGRSVLKALVVPWTVWRNGDDMW